LELLGPTAGFKVRGSSAFKDDPTPSTSLQFGLAHIPKPLLVSD
jgi:hypothetical protein